MIDPKFPRCFSTVTVCALKGLCEWRAVYLSSRSASVPVLRDCHQQQCQRDLSLASAVPPARYPPALSELPALPALPALQMWTGLLPTIWMSSPTKLCTMATSHGPGTSPGRPATRWVAGCSRRCCPNVCTALGCGSAAAQMCVWGCVVAVLLVLVLELMVHVCWPLHCRAQQESRLLDNAGGWAESRAGAGRCSTLSLARFP
jgi:hypothetical protein